MADYYKNEKKKKGIKPLDVAGGVVFGPAYFVRKAIVDKRNKMKQNPLFPEEYNSDRFDLPNIVQVVDDAVRRGNTYCEGSIGWRTESDQIEIMHLYDTEVENSTLFFDPAPIVGNFYYKDPHNKQHLISIDGVFEKIQEQKLAELENVAYCVGARKYEIEIIEKEIKSSSIKQKIEEHVNVKMVQQNTDTEKNVDESNQTHVRYHTKNEFYESRVPVIPELIWFKGDRNLQGLINHVCVDKARIKSKDLEFEGTKYSLMSESYAAKAEATIKKFGGQTGINLQKKVKRELASRIFLHLEF